MRRRHVDKPGLQRSDWSSTMDSIRPFEERGVASVGVFALTGLTLDALGLVLVALDTAAFQRYCRVVDGSGAAAALQLLVCFGPGVLLLAQDIRRGAARAGLLPWQRRMSIAVDGLALAYVGWYVFVLRGPWLTERASAQSRLDAWSACLSATFSGVPLVAFFHTVGFGVLFLAASAAALRAFAMAGYLQTPRLVRRFTAAVRILCAVDFAFVVVSIVTFATGSLL